MQFSEEVKATLWSLIDEMTLDLGRFTVNPDTDFKRKRKWDFQTLIKLGQSFFLCDSSAADPAA